MSDKPGDIASTPTIPASARPLEAHARPDMLTELEIAQLRQDKLRTVAWLKTRFPGLRTT